MDRETRDKQKDKQARDSQRDNERKRGTDRQTDRQTERERERDQIFELRMKLRTNNISSFEFFSTRAATSKRFQKLNKLWLTTKDKADHIELFPG